MYGMFWGASSFNQPIGSWNVARVTDMNFMFKDAKSFSQPLNGWNVANVVEMGEIFYGAQSFNSDLSMWDVTSVYDMQGAFAYSNFNRDVSHWDVRNLVKSQEMFENNHAFSQSLQAWEPKSLVQYTRMFYNATSYSEKLCWDLPPTPYLKSFQVFCFTDGAHFDPNCVDHTIVADAEKRCKNAITSYVSSFTDFFGQIVATYNDFIAFFQQIGNITCFAPDATTLVLDKGQVPMKNLHVGDKVLTSGGQYQPVYSMFHVHKSQLTLYMQIHTAHSENTTLTGIRPLEITPNHMLFVKGYKNPVPASQVQVGDYIFIVHPVAPHSVKNWHFHSALEDAMTLARVTNINKVIRNGLYNPLTPDGTIVVDGIAASAYGSFLGTEYIHLFRKSSSSSYITSDLHNPQDGWKVVSHQDFLHMLLAPYRAACLYLSPVLDLFIPELYNNYKPRGDEVSAWYGRLGQQILLFWLQQHVIVQALIFGLLFTVFGMLYLLCSPFGFIVLVTVSVPAVFCQNTAFLSGSSASLSQRRCHSIKKLQ